MNRNVTCSFVFLLTLAAISLEGQPPQPPAGAPGQTGQTGQTAPNQQNQPPRDLPPDSIRPNYVLGPNDQILVRAPEADEINEKPFRIDSEGFVNLPVVGRIRAAGLTLQELEAELVKRLREFIRNPQVIIAVTQFHSEPVFFVGAFKSPGIYALQGRRTLLDMLSSIGGLQPNASRRIKVMRHSEYGPIPLPNVVDDVDKKTSTVEIGLSSLRDNVNPAEDILLQPFDVISVERAELVYVTGDVTKIGTIELGERDSISVIQALTMVGGFTPDASRSKVKILRPIANTTRRAEIEIDVKRIFDGKDNDFPLLANDVLYVPHSSAHRLLTTMGAALIPSIPGLAVAAVLR
jgi:polysaccharide export outer membrane protein